MKKKAEIQKKRCVACVFAVLSALGLFLLGGCGKQKETAAPEAPVQTPTASVEEGKETTSPDNEEPVSSSVSNEHPSDEQDNIPVKIGCGESQRLALQYAGLKASEVTKLWSTLQKYEGKIIHEVTFVYDGNFYTYRINASTGADMGYTCQPAE